MQGSFTTSNLKKFVSTIKTFISVFNEIIQSTFLLLQGMRMMKCNKAFRMKAYTTCRRAIISHFLLSGIQCFVELSISSNIQSEHETSEREMPRH